MCVIEKLNTLYHEENAIKKSCISLGFRITHHDVIMDYF